MRRIIFIALILPLLSAGLRAQEQEAWTIEECIAYALDNNIELKRQQLNTTVKDKDLAQSKLNALPNLNGQVNHDLGSGRILDRGTYEWVNTDVSQGDLGLVSNVTLFKGLQGLNAIRMAEADQDVAMARMEASEDNLVLNIMTAYLEVLLKRELFEIAGEKVAVAGQQVERMEKLVEVGNASVGELLEVKATATTEEYNLTLARNNLTYARLELAQLLNYPDPLAFRITSPEIVDPSLVELPDPEEVYSNALEVLPQVEAARHLITYQSKELAVARGALSPELFVRALYYSNYSDKLINPREEDPRNPMLDYPVQQQVLDNQYKQVSIGLNIPVFNKWQNRTKISKAKISLEDAQYQLEEVKQQLYKDIQRYYAEVLGALDNYEAAKETQANSEEAYRYAEEKFKVGMATALELEEARNRLFTSRSEMVNTRYVFIFYHEILEFYQGKMISLN
jgi:outer membrane protein